VNAPSESEGEDRRPPRRLSRQTESLAAGKQVQAARLIYLVGRSARGHDDAFAELYDLTSSRIYGVILRVLRSPEQAAAVTQEVYLEIWQHAARYSEERGSVLAWMTTVAHRRAVERVRSDISRSETSSSEEGSASRDQSDKSDPEADPVPNVTQQQFEAERVRKGLASLTETQREAFSLAYFGGYTQGQVAALLKLPLDTVKTRIRDGLIGLRDALGVEA
jgi:RNA polymerase sigma-70 factor, ECF subfamily